MHFVVFSNFSLEFKDNKLSENPWGSELEELYIEKEVPEVMIGKTKCEKGVLRTSFLLKSSQLNQLVLLELPKFQIWVKIRKRLFRDIYFQVSICKVNDT